jgi:hypothetical protein
VYVYSCSRFVTMDPKAEVEVILTTLLAVTRHREGIAGSAGGDLRLLTAIAGGDSRIIDCESFA